MIPNIIHFVWVGGEMPEWALDNIDRFRDLNPGYKIRIHDERVLLPGFIDKYNHTPHMAAKADLIRYSALKRYGGWYFDVDIFPLRPLIDAVRGWGLDGTKLFISKQRGHSSGDRLPYANGILGCNKDCEGLDIVLEHVEMTDSTERCAYGPMLMAKAVEKHRPAFVIAESGWFFPIRIEQTMKAVPYLVAGREKELRLLTSYTAGQIPMGAHLWAGNPRVDLDKAFKGEICDRPVALVAPCGELDHPLKWVSKALESGGWDIERNLPVPDSVALKDPDVVITWNGMRDNDLFAKCAKQQGLPCIRLEHGFYDRREHAQADHEGILHWSSYARRIGREVPPEGAYERLSKFFTGRVEYKKRDGYILILGQVPGDSQLIGAAFQGPAPMLRTLARKIPGNHEAIFRPHPQAPRIGKDKHKFYSPIKMIDLGEDASAKYHKGMQANDIKECLEGAKFCIAVNSNALVDATMMGIPCLAFGPALGINAGVYRQADLNNLENDLYEMCEGWHPDPQKAMDFLAWLAAIQWSKEELHDPEIVQGFIDRALE